MFCFLNRKVDSFIIKDGKRTATFLNIYVSQSCATRFIGNGKILY